MKKNLNKSLLWKLCILLSFLLLFGFPKDIEISTLTTYTYNDTFKNFDTNELLIFYDSERKSYSLAVNDIFGLSTIELKKENRETFIAALDKYFEWEEKAIQIKAKIEKEINRVPVEIRWEFGDTWYASRLRDKPKMYINFFSQSETRHQLVLQFSKVESYLNEYIDKKVESLYFNKDLVLKLKEAFSPKLRQEKIRAAEEQEKLENEFQ